MHLLFTDLMELQQVMPSCILLFPEARYQKMIEYLTTSRLKIEPHMTHWQNCVKAVDQTFDYCANGGRKVYEPLSEEEHVAFAVLLAAEKEEYQRMLDDEDLAPLHYCYQTCMKYSYIHDFQKLQSYDPRGQYLSHRCDDGRSFDGETPYAALMSFKEELLEKELQKFHGTEINPDYNAFLHH